MLKRVLAEAVGTFWLVLGGCGTAVLAGQHVGFQGVALAFGLTVVTGAYALGRVSGGHFNPAVTAGLVAAGRTPASDLVPYIIAQAVGAIIAAAVLYAIASGAPGFDLAKGFASNGYAEHSPGGYGLTAAAISEVVLTAVFLVVIVGVTGSSATAPFAPLAIGLALTLIHLISIPVTNTSVNPARSLGPAVFVGDWALGQLWLFIVAPLVGGVIGGLIGRFVTEPEASIGAAATPPGAPAE
ncbi:aquaporin Z [Inquilinus sp. Marseille-Q2685]|uniref:aquaporin Z n=1 Tax=Inquilinus sp. Marseille-Q2685 TaxID=2866581 RepID=UPI001CE446B9|nr:aquaporin Z [Inquilinus sp. Marseille-Q2685]